MSNTNGGGYIINTANHDGVRIVLETDTYNNHILDGHPEMASNVAAIQDSIENPTYIIKGAQNENNRYYITKSPVSTYPKLYIKTVVNQKNPNIGYIRTSYFTRNVDLEKEGVVLYEKN